MDGSNQQKGTAPPPPPRFADAARFAGRQRDISYRALQHEFDLTQREAECLIDALADAGMIRRCRSSNRTVLLTAEQIEAQLAALGLGAAPEAQEGPTGTTGERAQGAPAAGGAPDQGGGQPGGGARRSERVSVADAPGTPDGLVLPWEDQEPTRMALTLDQITADPSIQCRVEANAKQVDRYAAAIGAGGFPCVTVFHEAGVYRLADGFHRHAAAGQAGLGQIEAEVYQGGHADAVLYAAGSNARHGLRRTNADKRLAVERVLRLPGWAEASDALVAEVAGVSPKTVASARRRLARTREIPECSTRRTRDNRRMNVTGMGGETHTEEAQADQAEPATGEDEDVGQHAGENVGDDVDAASDSSAEPAATEPAAQHPPDDPARACTACLDDLERAVDRLDAHGLDPRDAETLGRLERQIERLTNLLQGAERPGSPLTGTAA